MKMKDCVNSNCQSHRNGKKIPASVKYCPHCGEKQTKIPYFLIFLVILLVGTLILIGLWKNGVTLDPAAVGPITTLSINTPIFNSSPPLNTPSSIPTKKFLPSSTPIPSSTLTIFLSPTPTSIISSPTSTQSSIIQPVDAEMINISEGSVNYLDIYKKSVSENISSFLMDKYEVKVQDFENFVNKTGYKTDAEKVGFGMVWGANGEKVAQWVIDDCSNSANPEYCRSKIAPMTGAYQSSQWILKNGASWKNSNGTDNAQQDLNTPVVQISWNDADSYCKWTGKRLPTRGEWHLATKLAIISQVKADFFDDDLKAHRQINKYGEWVSDGGVGNKKLVEGEVKDVTYSLYPSLWFINRSSNLITFRCAKGNN
jgi:formylglycine-generating enzyme required for sulfatase activity